MRQTPTPLPADAALPELDAGEASAAATAASPAATLTTLTTTELAFEDPYPSDARPRASSALQAAADDEELARWNIGGTGDPNYLSSQASFHPGTRVVVDAHFPGRRAVTATSASNARGLTAERIQAQARSKGYWPFRLCFEAGQRERKGSGGETRVRFTIAARGDVSAARLISSELRNATTSACLVSAVRKLRFTPRPVRHLDVVTSIRIWPGDIDLPAVSEVPLGAVDTTSGFEPAQVRARVAAKAPELAACFSEARRGDPSLWGRLALAVVLEVDGSVHRVSEVESHFPNAAAARCAAAATASILFPSVSGKPFSFVLAMRLAPPSATGVAATEPAPRPDDEDAGSPAPSD